MVNFLLLLAIAALVVGASYARQIGKRTGFWAGLAVAVVLEVVRLLLKDYGVVGFAINLVLFVPFVMVVDYVVGWARRKGE